MSDTIPGGSSFARNVIEAYKSKLLLGAITGAAGATLSLAFRPVARMIDEKASVGPAHNLVLYARQKYPELRDIDPQILFGYAKLLYTSLRVNKDNMPFMAENLRNAVRKGSTPPLAWQSPGTAAEMVKWSSTTYQEMDTLQEKSAAAPLKEESGILGKIAIGAGLAAGAWGINKALNSGASLVEAHQHRKRFESALSKVVASNPVLKNAYKTDPKKVHGFAESIHSFAPRISGDPNVLSSLLSNAVHGESLDPMTVRTLLDMEGAQKKNHEQASPVAPIKLG